MRSPGHTAWRVAWLTFSVLVRCLWVEPVNDRKNCTSPRSPSLSASSQSWTVSTHLPWHRKRENCETKKLCLWIRNCIYFGAKAQTKCQTDPSSHLFQNLFIEWHVHIQHFQQTWSLIYSFEKNKWITSTWFIRQRHSMNVKGLQKVYFPCF